jgi:hypothetical protein
MLTLAGRFNEFRKLQGGRKKRNVRMIPSLAHLKSP